jgi:PAS domain-containing protein
MDELRALNSAAFERTPAHVAVLDEDGDIVLWNRAWDRFAADNGAAGVDWRRFNYGDVCRQAAASGDRGAAFILDAVQRSHITGAPQIFEYPCHSPTEERFFEVTISPLTVDDHRYVVVEHLDITARRGFGPRPG